MYRPVVVDTSFLVQLTEPGSLMVVEELEDRLGKLKMIVPSPVLDELERLARKKRQAEIALEHASRLEIYQSSLDPDRSVIEVAKLVGGFIASMDRGILDVARREGIPYITLKDDFPVVVG